MQHVEAVNAHDSARLLDTFTPNAVWATGHNVVHGTEALAELFDAWLWSLAPSLEVLSLVCEGRRAAAQLREVLTLDGETQDFTIGAFFHIQDGRISEGRVYREGTADVDVQQQN
jgi:ketosteroid isomerase-like protein